jgi:choline dehydrogenase
METRRLRGGNALDGTFDHVIVGAGSAGCVVARRLLDGTDATVLLLEAGGSDEGVQSISNPPQWIENIGSPYDWGYRYEPSPHVDHRSIPWRWARCSADRAASMP